MDIVALFEYLATTTHHKVNIAEMLETAPREIQEIFENNDALSLKAFFNGNNILADRVTIFEL